MGHSMIRWARSPINDGQILVILGAGLWGSALHVTQVGVAVSHLSVRAFSRDIDALVATSTKAALQLALLWLFER